MRSTCDRVCLFSILNSERKTSKMKFRAKTSSEQRKEKTNKNTDTHTAPGDGVCDLTLALSVFFCTLSLCLSGTIHPLVLTMPK